MLLATHFITAIRQLSSNKGKAALTILGVVIGIGSVISIMTLGEIAKNFLLGQITRFGTNVVEVAVSGDFGPFQSSNHITLKESDVQQIKQSSLLPELALVTGVYSSQANIIHTDKTHQDKTESAGVMGCTEDYMTMNNFSAIAGRSLTASDNLSSGRVIVLTKTQASDWFGSIDEAVSKTVKVDGHSFTVIGVIDDIPLIGAFGQTPVFMPLSTVHHLFAPANEQKDVTFIFASFKTGSNAPSFTERLKYEIYRLKHLKADDTSVTVISRSSFLSIFDSILLGMELFISSIAAISLVVGGIGIMNIMLVTVKERTKEIGLRKAVGAQNRSILIQFLIEAVVLTTVGGLIGILIGLSICLAAVVIVNAVQPSWDIKFVVVPSAIALACGVSVTTGIIFGLYPAWKASRLHPIEALRYE